MGPQTKQKRNAKRFCALFSACLCVATLSIEARVANYTKKRVLYLK